MKEKIVFYCTPIIVVLICIVNFSEANDKQSSNTPDLQGIIKIALADGESGDNCTTECPGGTTISVPCGCDCIVLPGSVRCLASVECGFNARFTLAEAQCD
jgi:hypothetical protein